MKDAHWIKVEQYIKVEQEWILNSDLNLNNGWSCIVKESWRLTQKLNHE